MRYLPSRPGDGRGREPSRKIPRASRAKEDHPGRPHSNLTSSLPLVSSRPRSARKKRAETRRIPMASSPAKSQDPQEPQSRWRRGLRAFTREFVIPIVLALIFIQFAVQAFKIPSASMERSLHIGDFLLGLKFIYGSPIPFTHKRLPALVEPKPGDVLIFRYPGDPFYPEGKPERYRFLANLFLFGNLYWDRTPAEGENSLVW